MGLALRARAKLNLYLAVRARRGDGYHEIDTLFHSLEMADGLTVEENADFAVTCEPAVSVGDGENLALSAARELAEDAGVTAGIRIAVDKRIPVAAGLGGGSADAAGALVAANELWGLRWPDARLATVGSAVGADVPFMIGGGAAIGRGRGDELEPVAPWPGLCILLALPKRPLSTAEVYAAVKPDAGGVLVEGAAAAVSARSLPALAELMRNDLTEAAVSLAPEIAVALAAARQAGVPALMSGSGPTVFALTDDPERREALARAWAAAGFETAETESAPKGVTIE